jgi:hypothetical protein
MDIATMRLNLIERVMVVSKRPPATAVTASTETLPCGHPKGIKPLAGHPVKIEVGIEVSGDRDILVIRYRECPSINFVDAQAAFHLLQDQGLLSPRTASITLGEDRFISFTVPRPSRIRSHRNTSSYRNWRKLTVNTIRTMNILIQSGYGSHDVADQVIAQLRIAA